MIHALARQHKLWYYLSMKTLLVFFVLLSSCSSRSDSLQIVLPAETHRQLFIIPDSSHRELTSLCEETGIPLDILFRLIDSESAWNPSARNVNADGSEDIGLGQLNSAYLSYYASMFGDGDLDPYCPEQNITITARYMVHLYDRVGSWEGAVVAYKIGPSRIDKAGPGLRKVARYVARGS